MKTVAPRTFNRLMRMLPYWKCPRCGASLAGGSLSFKGSVRKGRHAADFTKKCACNAEHRLLFTKRSWQRLTMEHFDVAGTRWTAIFDDSPPVTFFFCAGGGSATLRSFDEIVEPSRFAELIAFA